MSGLNDHDIEALLRGRAPDGLEQLTALVERVRREASASISPAEAGRHVAAAIAAAVAAAREAPVPTPVPASATRPTWRRRTVFAGLLSTILGKILLGTVAFATAAAGAGAAGVLPEPIQGFVDGNQEIHQIADQIREQERLQLHEQEPLGDQQQIRDRDQLQLHDPEEAADQSETQNQFQNRFEHQHHGSDLLEPNEYQFEYWFRFRFGQEEDDGTTTGQQHQQHQQQQQQVSPTESTSTTLQLQQQQQQLGPNESTSTTLQLQQQQQQRQHGSDPSTGGTAAGSSGDAPDRGQRP